jgi:hypothetical protein
MEMRTAGDKESKSALYYEVAPHMNRADLEVLNKHSVEVYIVRRTSPAITSVDGSEEGGVLVFSVAELESRIENLKAAIPRPDHAA